MENKKFLDSLMGLLAINSVAYVDADEQHPYGKAVSQALEYVLNLGEELGMRVVNRDGKIAWVEIGEGDEIVGILGHLDIVPIGEGWTHNPLGEICGDKLYGRGTSDDKGPTLAAMFAMKELMDAGVKLNRRVRLILGQCEEVGEWTDMQYYCEHEQLPVFGFTPDAEFPAIYGEKGIMRFELTLPVAESGLEFAEGGDAGNMVPGWARAAAAGADYTAEGTSAHASTPEKGVNAISKLMEQLPGKFAEFYNKHVGFDYNGGKMGCGFEDEASGKLTLNAGTLRTEDGLVKLVLDIRCPVTFTLEQVQGAIEAACAPYGIAVENTAYTPSVYMDKNGRVITTMIDVYREITGDMTEPMVIGGGTYARAMPGIVAYGMLQPHREGTEHQKDEYVYLDDLYQAKDIYRIAIERLANLQLNDK
ncbi:MAG: Sapep family Mn(2+)-dependent dipeptidase [Oscillospiraceae bacterium]|nr:Sapep family Mn(2+)-dependent dipeptidase [Oscillospiraceae bacterium]